MKMSPTRLGCCRGSIGTLLTSALVNYVPNLHPSAIGWTWALTLSEISPDQTDAILARGRAFGESRVVCNGGKKGTDYFFR